MVLRFERWIFTKAVVVVTGASAGIGAAIAERLVQKGLTVVGIARRVEKVEALAKKLSGEKGKLIALKADVSDEKQVIKAFDWIKNHVGPIHILINNAAHLKTSKESSILEASYEHWREKFETNVYGLLLGTKLAVEQMRANKINGHIIHINSVAGHTVVSSFPNIASYTATKFSVTALTEALRNELREAKTKIKVTSISPGVVETEATESLPEQFGVSIPMLAAEDIADAVDYVLSSPEHVQIHELTIRPVGEQF